MAPPPCPACTQEGGTPRCLPREPRFEGFACRSAWSTPGPVCFFRRGRIARTWCSTRETLNRSKARLVSFGHLRSREVGGPPTRRRCAFRGVACGRDGPFTGARGYGLERRGVFIQTTPLSRGRSDGPPLLRHPHLRAHLRARAGALRL